MKKTILFLCLFGIFLPDAKAQVRPHSLGFYSGLSHGRLQNKMTFQLSLSPKYRLDLGASFTGGFGSNNTYLRGGAYAYYQRVWNFYKGFNFYAGLGGQYNFLSHDHISGSTFRNSIGLGGQLGIEYDFSKHNFPLVVGIETRPTVQFSNFATGAAFDLQPGISLRYRF